MRAIDIPRLETERLILRAITEDDFEAYARIVADAEVMRFLGGGKPMNRHEAWRQFAFIIGHWHIRGYGLWAVEEKSSGKLVGRIGFLKPEGWPDFELAWTLARDEWGKGFATEGARRALHYAFEEMGRERVISLIHPDNHASIKVAERIGERQIGTVDLFGHEVLMYGIDRTEWENKANGSPFL